MQKILHFELGMAIKDRPKTFQVITLILFAFSLTMILLGAIARLTQTGHDQQVLQDQQVNHYANFATYLPPEAPIKK